MSGHGGKREGAGRKPGAITKKTREIAEREIVKGLTPLDYMLKMLRDERADEEKRMWAAEKAAPYVHAKLAAVEHSGRLDVKHGLADMTDEELAAIATGCGG